MKAWIAVIAAAALSAAGTAAAEWTGAQAIDADAGTTTEFPQAAFDGAGNAVAVFSQAAGAGAVRIYANRFAPGSGWQTAVIIDGGTPGDQYGAPQVALSATGTGFAAYTDWDADTGPSNHIGVNAYTGWAWAGETFPMDDAGVRSAWKPQIACDAQGNAVLLYYRMDGTGEQRLYARRYTTAGGWEARVGPLDAATGKSVQEPRLVLAPDGSGFAVFQQALPDGSQRVYARRYSGSGWDASAVPLDPGGGYCDYPSIAVSTGGDAVAGFRAQFGAADDRVYAARYHGGAWLAPERIDGGSAANPSSPDVAIDGDGNIIAVFTRKEGGILRARATRYDAAAAAWLAPELIDHSPSSSIMSARVAMNANGGGVAAYDVSSVDGGVYGNVYTSEGGWGGAARIDAGTTQAQDATVAVDASGNAIAVFKQSVGAGYRVYANRHDRPAPTPTPTPTAAPPIDLSVNKSAFSTSGHIAVTADVQALAAPFFPFVRLVMQDGSTLYFSSTRGLTASVAPYLDGGPFTLAGAIDGYPIAEADFAGVAQGTYRLEGGAVDAAKTASVDNLIYLGGVDAETLVVH